MTFDPPPPFFMDECFLKHKMITAGQQSYVSQIRVKTFKKNVTMIFYDMSF